MQVGINQFNTNFEHPLKKMTCTTYLFAAPPEKKNMPKAVCFRHCALRMSVWEGGVTLFCISAQRLERRCLLCVLQIRDIRWWWL